MIRLKLTVTGASTPEGVIDLEVDAAPDMTVGELAADLAERSPHHDIAATTLAIARKGVRSRPIDPALTLDAAPIVSGCTIDLVTGPAPAHASDDTVDPQPTAVVVITGGNDAGLRFALHPGTTVLGRDGACDIVIADESVSRRHLQIDLGAQIVITDLGSANGTRVAGDAIDTATLEPGGSVDVGSTTIRVDLDPTGKAAASAAFVRSPPTAAPVIPEEIEAPKVPAARKPPRIPVIAAIAPILMGTVMYLVTQRAQTLIFIALSPIMLMGNAVESRITNRKSNRQGREKFETEYAAFEADARHRIADETRFRRAEHPALDDLTDAVLVRTPVLWSRRPDSEHFAELCIGRGRQPARHTFTANTHEDSDPDLVVRMDTLLGELTHVDDVPVVADLAETGSVGVAGPTVLARSVAASMVASAVLMHSPAELGVALFASDSSSDEWRWLRWLPHVDARYAPIAPALADTPSGCVALQAGLAQVLDARAAIHRTSSSARHLPAILVVIEDDASIERSLLVDLLERGPSVGIHPVWIATAVERLPAGCGVVVDTAEGSNQMTARVRVSKELHEGIRTDLRTQEQLELIARALSPLVDTGARARGETGLPEVVLGPELLALPPDPSAESIVERWRATSIDGLGLGRGDTRLVAPVGIANDEPFELDLRRQGPHALVGGTTGAGKSEFLQSWVMGLAATYSANRVNFLFVDYKGGAAFSECVNLPHCVGLVTDLSPHLVDRALGSLHAELHRREHLFNDLDAKDIIELEKRGSPQTPPVLIIVVDEFAALVQEVPDFVDGVVNVAQRGRSLGLHLILATQRPAGVITGNLRANTNIRVALRMADESDSSDVIDSTEAAFIDAVHPGRGFAKAGPGRSTPFQSAFYGGQSTEDYGPQSATVRPLGITAGEEWPTVRREKADDDTNDLERLVTATKRAALVGQFPAPRRPWLPELPAEIDLREAELTRTDTALVFGTADNPSEQAQPPIAFHPDRDGNLVIIGGSGSGKSTLMRTLAITAGASIPNPEKGSGPCHVYGIDFGSRGLQMLDAFGHVGSIIDGDDHERIERLLRTMRDAIDERQDRFQAAAAASIGEYRARTGNVGEARILLMIDNYGAMRQAYDNPERAATLDLLTSIMSDGRSTGVHVVISVDRPGAMPSSVSSIIPRRLVLRLSNESDLMLIGEPTGVLAADGPPGRGLEGGREFQVAVLGGTSNLAEQTDLARALAQNEMFGAGAAPAPPVQALPSEVFLEQLPESVGDQPTIGVEDATLGSVGVEPVGAFLVAGPPGSGRTTAVATLSVSLRRWQPDFQQVLFADRRSPLAAIDTWTTAARRPEEHAQLATTIATDLKKIDGSVKGLAIVLENVTELLDDPAVEGPVLELVKVALAVDAFVIAEGESSQMIRAWKLDPIKNHRTGLILQPQLGDGDLLKANFPRFGRNEFPVGRGIHVVRRHLAKVQVARPQAFSP